MSKTNIEWTNETLNPTSGCSRKSEGCRNCYAETMTKRLALMGNEKYQGLLNEDGRFNGVIKFDEKSLLNLLTIKKPTTFFINSMSDLFHENVKEAWIEMVFSVMALSPQHTFQILTKRPERMLDFMDTPFGFLDSLEFWWENYPDIANNLTRWAAGFGGEFLPNVHLGVSVENQKEKSRIDLLRQTTAALRFLSCEPLLEDLGELNLSNIDWVIVGGESGQNKLKIRSCNLAWIRSIVDQCKSARVPVFVKQLGTNSYYFDEIRIGEYEYKTKNKKGADMSEFPEDLRIRQMPEIK